MTHPFRTILFDFDYTLADSSTGIIECVNYALKALGLPTVSDDAVRKTIGLKLPDMFVKYTGESNARDADRFAQLFIERADIVMADSTVLFDATRTTIEMLHARGLLLGIVTTKFRRRIETILQREDLGDRFNVVVGAEDVSAHKPDPESLFLAMKRLEGSPAETLYVGDNIVDAGAAQHAGVSFVGVLSGMTSRQAFGDYPHRAILEGVGQLPPWIEVYAQELQC